jgi:low temperature requirement protein LtrA
VYVAVIGQAAHHLAGHVSVGGLASFAVVFALIWIAWINGSLYLELHGRQDGRTRSIVVAQMGVLVLLAVCTADAADGSGRGFAVGYGTYQVLQTGLWFSVWRQDRRDRSQLQALAGGYVAAMGGSVVVIGASAFLPAIPRLVVWAGVGWPGSSGSCWPPAAPASGWAWPRPARWSSGLGCSPSSSWARSSWGWWPALRGRT